MVKLRFYLGLLILVFLFGFCLVFLLLFVTGFFGGFNGGVVLTSLILFLVGAALFRLVYKKIFSGQASKDNYSRRLLTEESARQAAEEAEERRREKDRRAEEKRAEKQREVEARRVEMERQSAYFESIKSQCKHELIPATVLGGSGWEDRKGDLLLLSCRDGSLCFSDIKKCETIEVGFADFVGAEITGPGKQTTDFGVVGGGFGLEGAAKGILVAAVVNALTTRTTIDTFLRLTTRESEVFLHTASSEPSDLRVILSPLFLSVENLKSSSGVASSVVVELEKVKQLFQDGHLTQSEFAIAKYEILKRKRVT